MELNRTRGKGGNGERTTSTQSATQSRNPILAGEARRNASASVDSVYSCQIELLRMRRVKQGGKNFRKREFLLNSPVPTRFQGRTRSSTMNSIETRRLVRQSCPALNQVHVQLVLAH